MSDIEIDVSKSAGEENSSSSSGGGDGGGGRRGTIHVKLPYGTKQYTPDTDCCKCRNRAVGVLIVDRETVPDNKLVGPFPLCSRHRNEVREDKEKFWQISEFRRFVDA